MVFSVKNRAYSDDNISEVAGKLLPLHPTARYKNFPHLWKKTRQVGGYVPRPARCTTGEDELFPCCLTCAATTPGSLKEILVRRRANVGWLSADRWWDFGWTLPEEFVSFGVGITPPEAPIERDRVFVFNPNFSRGYLDIGMEEHAKAGAVQHEARVKIITSSASVNFPGEIVASTSGRIEIAVPRAVPFGKGLLISERYIFEVVEMPFSLPILTDGGNFIKEGDKILLNGVALN